MRGLSLIGLLATLVGAGMLIFTQVKPSPETGKSRPVESIEKANDAAQSIEQQAEQRQKDIQELN